MVAVHVAAEDFHRADAEAEREKRLIHRRNENAADSLLHGAPPIGQKEERKPVLRAGEGEAVHGQHGNQHDQRAHHPLGDALHAVLQAEAANRKAEHDGQRHVAAHLAGAFQHPTKNAGNRVAAQAAERAGQEFEEIAEHPAADRGVIHHQHAAAEQAEIAVQMPLRAPLFQRAIRLRRRSVTRAADSQLHGQHGNAHRQQEDQIKQHEYAATVLPRDRRKAPDVADADRAARADEQKAQSRSEVLALGRRIFILIHGHPSFAF